MVQSLRKSHLTCPLWHWKGLVCDVSTQLTQIHTYEHTKLYSVELTIALFSLFALWWTSSNKTYLEDILNFGIVPSEPVKPVNRLNKLIIINFKKAAHTNFKLSLGYTFKPFFYENHSNQKNLRREHLIFSRQWTANEASFWTDAGLAGCAHQPSLSLSKGVDSHEQKEVQWWPVWTSGHLCVCSIGGLICGSLPREDWMLSCNVMVGTWYPAQALIPGRVTKWWGRMCHGSSWCGVDSDSAPRYPAGLQSSSSAPLLKLTPWLAVLVVNLTVRSKARRLEGGVTI